MTEGDEDARILDIEVATTLEGFRWARWAPDAAPDAPADARGRFLAPPRHLLAHLWLPARKSCPTGPQPFRYLPQYSREAEAALRACEQCGLFRAGGATLRRGYDGRWRITSKKAGLDLSDASLPRLLCLAGLEWSRLQHGHGALS